MMSIDRVLRGTARASSPLSSETRNWRLEKCEVKSSEFKSRKREKEKDNAEERSAQRDAEMAGTLRIEVGWALC